MDEFFRATKENPEIQMKMGEGCLDCMILDDFWEFKIFGIFLRRIFIEYLKVFVEISLLFCW